LKITITDKQNTSIKKSILSLNDLEQLDQFPCPELIRLDLDDAKKIESALRKIRSDHQNYLAPVFLQHNVSELSGFYLQLLDGIGLESKEDEDKKSLKINELVENINKSIQHNDPEQQLLMLMLTRPQIRLNYQLDPTQPCVIRYPLAELYIPDRLLAKQRIDSLLAKDMLLATEVKDEIQSCPYCNNNLINFKKLCPNCGSVDIKKEKFLHCFTCGNTEPERVFLRADELRCSNCNTVLRHIGIDYDRPLEENICTSCKSSFIDPNVQCLCFTCNRSFDPQSLVSYKLCEYKLADKAIQYLTLPHILENNMLIDQNHFVDPTVFTFFLDWQIKASLRYKSSSFSLINIKISNSNELINKYGITQTRQIVDELFQFIRSCSRNTDLFTRMNVEMATILFSFSNSADALLIKTNIQNHIQRGMKQGIDVNLIIQTSSSDELDLSKYNANLLLHELNSRE
jgi:GGDEF domain-containing protein